MLSLYDDSMGYAPSKIVYMAWLAREFEKATGDFTFDDGTIHRWGLREVGRGRDLLAEYKATRREGVI